MYLVVDAPKNTQIILKLLTKRLSVRNKQRSLLSNHFILDILRVIFTNNKIKVKYALLTNELLLFKQKDANLFVFMVCAVIVLLFQRDVNSV